MTNLTRRTVPTITTLNPLHVMDALLRWDPIRDADLGAPTSAYAPAFDVKETKDAYVIQADLPGIREGALDVTVTGAVVTVSGKREPALGGTDERYYALERGYGAFSRTFTLPEGANVDDLSANLDQGVLTLHIPKRPEVQPRKISLKKDNRGNS
ncbi:MAG TPA: Hsp20 family protein [Polyangia bacterium]|nr:Hsp20 family protein [Polyangia bacterium]